MSSDTTPITETVHNTLSPYNKKLLLLGMVLTIALLIPAVFLLKTIWQHNQVPIAPLIQAKTHYYTLTDNVTTALQGDSAAFKVIKQERYNINQILQTLEDNNTISPLLTHWAQFETTLDLLNQQQSFFIAMPQKEKRVDKETNALYNLLNQFALRAAESGSYSTETIHEVGRLALDAQKISAEFDRILLMPQIPVNAVANLNSHLQNIQKQFDLLLSGDPISGIQSLRGSIDEETIIEAQSIFSYLLKHVGDLLANIPELTTIKQLTQETQLQKNKFIQSVENEINKIYQSENNLQYHLKIISSLIIAAFLCLMIVFTITWTLLKHKTVTLKYDAYSEKERSERHERAILRLINEIDTLAKGDLTTVLSVTEDSTGIVADSVNLAVESFRDLIITLRDIDQKFITSIQAATTLKDQWLNLQRQYPLSEDSQIQHNAQLISQSFENLAHVANALQNTTLQERLQAAHLLLSTLTQQKYGLSTDHTQLANILKDIIHKIQDLKSTLVLNQKTHTHLASLLSSKEIDRNMLNTIVTEQQQLNQAQQKFWSMLQTDLISAITLSDKTLQNGQKYYQSVDDLNLIFKQVDETYTQKLSLITELNNQIQYTEQQQTDQSSVITKLHKQLERIEHIQQTWLELLHTQQECQSALNIASKRFALPTDDPEITAMQLTLEKIRPFNTQQDNEYLSTEDSVAITDSAQQGKNNESI